MKIVIDVSEVELAMLSRIYDRLKPIHLGYENVFAVYKTPAQRLRERADELEAAEKDVELFNQFVSRLTTQAIEAASFDGDDGDPCRASPSCCGNCGKE